MTTDCKYFLQNFQEVLLTRLVTHIIPKYTLYLTGYTTFSGMIIWMSTCPYKQE